LIDSPDSSGDGHGKNDPTRKLRTISSDLTLSGLFKCVGQSRLHFDSVLQRFGDFTAIANGRLSFLSYLCRPNNGVADLGGQTTWSKSCSFDKKNVLSLGETVRYQIRNKALTRSIDFIASFLDGLSPQSSNNLDFCAAFRVLFSFCSSIFVIVKDEIVEMMVGEGCHVKCL
jgi:hypothetical protein